MPYLLRTIALAPVIVPQGIWTNLRVPTLPEPPGARQGKAGKGPRLRLLIVGDSAAAGVGVSRQEDALMGQVVSRLSTRYRVEFELQAKTGFTTANILRRLDELPARTFDVALTSLGVNDVLALTGRSTWLGRQRQLRGLLREKFGVRLIIVSGLPPVHSFPALPQPLRWHLGSRATEFNDAMAAAVASEPDVRLIDLRFEADIGMMASDGFHPGVPIYSEWAERAASFILSLDAAWPAMKTPIAGSAGAG
ncbi:MAG TPA: SGNH/GDSL hydrolase family protein [Woeseiaceae bacterium]|nr:SGNH/GDSL hydrolase family protein [Woeseiaceae bacterium]